MTRVYFSGNDVFAENMIRENRGVFSNCGSLLSFWYVRTGKYHKRLVQALKNNKSKYENPSFL